MAENKPSVWKQDSENIKYLIYALCDPTTEEVRYIGRSSSGLIRPRHHWTSLLNKKTYCHSWCKSILKKGLEPKIKILESFENCEEINDVLNKAEIKWIKHYKERGARLTNHTDGGGGLLNLAEEVREKLRLHRMGVKEPEWVREKKSRFHKENYKKNPSRYLKLMEWSKDRRLKLSKTVSGEKNPFFGKTHTKETIEKIKHTWFKPGQESPNKGKKMSDETKKKISETKKRKFASGEIVHHGFGKGKKVICINDGAVYDTITSASQRYGISETTVTYVCKNKQPCTKNGLIFKYLE